MWLGLSLLAFSLANLAPGDPATIILRRQTGEQPSDSAVQALRRKLGLNDPFAVRYGRWLIHAAQGDLGTSYRGNAPVLPTLGERFVPTFQLSLAALLIAVGIAVPLGMLSAIRRDRPIDHASRLLALMGASMPSFCNRSASRTSAIGLRQMFPVQTMRIRLNTNGSALRAGKNSVRRRY